MAASEEDKLPESELLGQMAYVHIINKFTAATNNLIRTLLFAATDTTSSAISRILHLLAENPEVQQKLRDEIVASKRAQDEIPYDELSSLPYLDAVCRETLRLYAPFGYHRSSIY